MRRRKSAGRTGTTGIHMIASAVLTFPFARTRPTMLLFSILPDFRHPILFGCLTQLVRVLFLIFVRHTRSRKSKFGNRKATHWPLDMPRGGKFTHNLRATCGQPFSGVSS